MNDQILNIAFEQHVDQEAVTQLQQTLAVLGNEVEFHEVPDKGPQASLLLLGMSSVALIFGGAFAKKLGERAAEDSWPLIKKGLSKIYQKYFGENPEHKVVIFTSSEEKAPDSKYSLILSLYCVGKNGQRVKFLYESKWTQVQFDKATEVYLSSISEFVALGSGEVQALIDKSPSKQSLALVAWDDQNQRLISVNVLPNL